MNKDNTGLTLTQRCNLEISDEQVMDELLNTKHHMNKFTVVKFGQKLKSTIFQRCEMNVSKPTIQSKRNKDPIPDANKEQPKVDDKRSSEQVDRTISQASAELENIEAQFSPVRPAIKTDSPSYYQPQSPAGSQKKELRGQNRDTAIVLDSTDTKQAESKQIDSSQQMHPANVSTAASVNMQPSRAGSKKKAPKQTAQIELTKPTETKQEEILDDDDDIAHHLYETIKCVNCKQPPVQPKQCASCQNLTCGQCLETSKKCTSCGSSTFGPVKDKILLMILDKFVLFNHQCTADGPVKTFSQSEMDQHKNSHTDCPSRRYRCFCQKEDDQFTMTYDQIITHLKTECGKVKIQCHQCQHNQSFEDGSFTREEFKTHKCYTDLLNLQTRLKEDQEFMLAQAVQIQSQKSLYAQD